MLTSKSLLPLSLFCAQAALAGMPFPVEPDWVSADIRMVSTGGALVDMDKDGWLDLVVANGNDIERQPITVYYNQGDGSLPVRPDWSSQSTEYHGHLSVGDVNQDGWPDVAVSVFLGPGGFSQPGWVALYLNDAAGSLSATPDWVSADPCYSFGVALGDADSDGDLDLAVALGEPYTTPPNTANRVYYNQGGTLEDTPSWVSDEVEHNLALSWGDADGDGDLDLAFAGSFNPHRIYYQTGGVLETTAGWQSSLDSPVGIRLGFGDIDRDGFQDLAVSENNEITSGDGRFRVFYGTDTSLEPDDSWRSNFSGYCSEAVLGDANGDGWLDLLGGSWGANGNYFDQVRIYPNRYTQPFASSTGWESSPNSGWTSVIEKLLLGDVDNDGLASKRQVFAVDEPRQLFYLERIPFREITRIAADGLELAPDQYCFDRESGWISLAQSPSSELVVEYIYSTRQDLVVLNWDDDQGNYLFYAVEPPLLLAVKGQTDSEIWLQWTGGLPEFDVLASQDPRFGPGLSLEAAGLPDPQWEDQPGSLSQGGTLFYSVY